MELSKGTFLVRLLPTLAQHQQNPHPVQVHETGFPFFFCQYASHGPVYVLIVSASGSKAASVDEVCVYVDLAYIPSGSSSPTVTVDFFRCIRSSCYIISGNSPEQEELMRQTLDALLDGKTFWPDTMQV